MKEDETLSTAYRRDSHESRCYADGMHCMNCKNSVTRSLQKMSGVSADVDLKHGVQHMLRQPES